MFVNLSNHPLDQEVEGQMGKRGPGIQSAEIPILSADPDLAGKVIREAFSGELLDLIEQEHPGSTRHYVDSLCEIMAIAYSMTQPGEGPALMLKAEALGLVDEELALLLKGMAVCGMIRLAEDGGIRITELGLSMIAPRPPVEKH